MQTSRTGTPVHGVVILFFNDSTEFDALIAALHFLPPSFALKNPVRQKMLKTFHIPFADSRLSRPVKT